MKNLNTIPTTITFTDRYTEYVHLGYPDWQIANKMRLTPKSLYRQLHRHGVPVRPELQRMIRGDDNA